MPTRAARALAAMLTMVAAVAPIGLAAQDADFQPLLGTWAFVPEKSTADPDLIPFRRGTCTIQRRGDALRIAYDFVRLRGGVTHLEWTGAIDGQDYAVQGVDSDVTNAYRRVDPQTYEVVQKVNGVVSLIQRLRLSADGNVITTSATLRSPDGTSREVITTYARLRSTGIRIRRAYPSKAPVAQSEGVQLDPFEGNANSVPVHRAVEHEALRRAAVVAELSAPPPALAFGEAHAAAVDVEPHSVVRKGVVEPLKDHQIGCVENHAPPLPVVIGRVG